MKTLLLLLLACPLFAQAQCPSLLTWYPIQDATNPPYDTYVGFNVYRSVGVLKQSWQLQNTNGPIKNLYWVDEVLPGQQYGYEVTSVDSSGKESQPSTMWVTPLLRFNQCTFQQPAKKAKAEATRVRRRK